MNKRALVISLVVVGSLVSTALVPKASAFWLFDIFKGGSVKGESTQVSTSGAQRVNPTPLPKVTPAPVATSLVSTEEQVRNDVRLIQLVNNSRLTPAQKKEFMVRLTAIRIERAKLMKMEQDLIVWLRNNHIDPGAQPTPSISPARPGVTPTTQRTQNFNDGTRSTTTPNTTAPIYWWFKVAVFVWVKLQSWRAYQGLQKTLFWRFGRRRER